MSPVSKENLEEQQAVLQMGPAGLAELASKRGWSRGDLRLKIAEVRLLHLSEFQSMISAYECPMELAAEKDRLGKETEERERLQSLFKGVSTEPRIDPPRVKAKKQWPDG